MCRRHGVMIISDFAYGEVCFDGYKAPSFLSADGAKEIGVEFTTMSKSYNMAGWRCGFCAGNAEMVKALATIKGYYDYGMFAPIQIASIIAMRECGDTPGRAGEDLPGPPRRGLPRPRQARLDLRKAAGQHVRLGEDQARAFQEGRGHDRLLPADDGRSRSVALARAARSARTAKDYVRIALVENEHRLRQAMRNLERVLNPREPKPKRVKANA